MRPAGMTQQSSPEDMHSIFVPFSQRTHLEKHLRKEFKCKECPYTCLARSGLQTHVETYHEKQKYPCKLCNTTLSSSQGLACHIKIIHSKSKELRHCCGKCEYKSYWKNNLTEHLKRMHGGSKTHNCYFCGRKFFRFYDLNKHCRLMHTLEK